MTFLAWVEDRAARVDRELDLRLSSFPPSLCHFQDAMRYAVLGSGKRVRPLLVFAVGELLGVPLLALDCMACSVELLHTYSLVHDDLPSMDNDVLRRGRPTTHVVYGEAMAILVGDGLHSLAFEVLCAASCYGVSPACLLEMVRVFSSAVGPSGMVGGQAIDILSVGISLDLPSVQEMHHRKTGALLRACVKMAAIAGGISFVEKQNSSETILWLEELLENEKQSSLESISIADAIDCYACAIGLAFQMVDDVLDVVGEQSVLGKTVGKDEQAAKPSYPSLVGLEKTRVLVRQLYKTAVQAISVIPDADHLVDLAGFIVDRSS